MKLQALKNAVTSKVGRQVLILNKKSPTILFAAGVIGVVGTVVLASRATLRLEEVLKDGEKDAQLAKDFVHADYHEKDLQRDLVKVKFRTGGEVVKLYAPAAVVGVVSIVCLTKSHQILMNRNTALMAAYSALDSGFRQYRQRVVDELGPDKDREFRHGSEERLLVEEVDGKTKTSQVVAFDSNQKPTVYAQMFQEGVSSEWSRDPNYNWKFLKCQQEWWTQKLHADGFVFLNDVYHHLGFPKTSFGQLVGWVKGNGDDYIDFGIFDGKDILNRSFILGHEGAILLDFNVDGVVYDLIDKKETP